MRDQPNFVLDALRDLQSRAEANAKNYPGLRHMLVLPPGESIRVPPPSGCRPLGVGRQQRKYATVRFGETELVGKLPPRKSWPKGTKPLRAVVAGPSDRRNPHAEQPYRIHLFFDGNAGGFKRLQSLADDLAGIRQDVTRALSGNDTLLPCNVFYADGYSGHDEKASRLDSWLCTVHWWAWFWTECPFRTRPRVVHASRTYETDPRDEAVKSKLAFSLFDADVLAASAATLSLILGFFEEPPVLYGFAEYPYVPKPDEMLPVEVASLSERFIRYVAKYLEGKASGNPLAVAADPSLPGSVAEGGILDHLKDANGGRNKAAARIWRYGPALAAALKRYDCNSEGVLSVVQTAGEGGGGPSEVLPTWEQTRAALQQDANQLRRGNTSRLPQPKVSNAPADTQPSREPRQISSARPDTGMPPLDGPSLTNSAIGTKVAEPMTNPERVAHLKPSRAKAKAIYEWSMAEIDGAEDLTYAELFDKLTTDPRCDGEGLPGNAATFARYCRAAGIRRNTPRCKRGVMRSVRRASDL